MNQTEFNGKSILIADDEEYVRHHLAKKLKSMGLRVFEAGTGMEVLNLAGEHPDLIIMDVKMPVLDGLETARRLKSDHSTRGIPVVLLSAMAQQAEVDRGMATGADEYVMKPITFNRLMDSIRTFIH
jgi:CheY-like chemotaxis protein